MDKILLMRKVLRGEVTHEPTYMEKLNNDKYYFTGEYVPGLLKTLPTKESIVWDEVYVENKKGYSCAFLWKRVVSEMRKQQPNLIGVMSGNCRLYTPDGRVFNNISISSDANFSKDIFLTAVLNIGSSIAHIEMAENIFNSMFKIDDGNNFKISDCGIEFPGTKKGRNKI